MFRLLSALLLLSSLAVAEEKSELIQAIEEAQTLSIKEPLLALATQKDLLNKIDGGTQPQLKLQVFAQLSNTLSNMSRYPEALDFAQQGIKLFESLNAPESMSGEAFELRRGIATAYIFLGNEPGATEILDKLEADAKQQNKNELLSGVYFQKGLMYSNSRRSVEALETLSQAWTLAGPNDLEGQGDMFHLLGNAYQTSGEWQRAIQMHEAAIEELKALNLAQRLSLVGYALGTIQQNREAYDEAVKWFTQARNWAREVNDPIGEAFNHLQIATVLIKKRDYVGAGRALDACEKTFVQNGFLPQQVLLELARGDISMAQQNPQRALGNIIAAEARVGVRELPPPVKRKLIRLKVDVLKTLERHDQAAEAASKLADLPPEESNPGALLSDAERQRLQTISATLDKQMLEFKQQKVQQHKASADAEQQQLMQQWGIIGGGSLLVILFFFWFVRRRRN